MVIARTSLKKSSAPYNFETFLEMMLSITVGHFRIQPTGDYLCGAEAELICAQPQAQASRGSIVR